jgi:hypothetical protein
MCTAAISFLKFTFRYLNKELKHVTAHILLSIIQPTSAQIILNTISIRITGSYMFRHSISHRQRGYSVTLLNYIYKYFYCRNRVFKNIKIVQRYKMEDLCSGRTYNV